MKLDVYYDSETDTLSLWNGQPASSGADVAENLTVDLDAEGEAVGFTLEHASEILKAVVARPFLAWKPEGLTPEDGEHPPGTLKAVADLLFSARNPERLTPEDNQRKAEMLKEVGGHQFVVLDPQGLTPEDIEKWGIRSTVWVGQPGHFVDSGKK